MIHDEKTDCEIHEMPNIAMHDIHKQYGLWLIRGGSGTSPVSSWQCRKRYFQFYCISHMHRGYGRLWLESGLETDMKPGDCVIITPGTVHQYGGYQDIYSEDTINFCGPVADMLTRAGIISNGVFPMGGVRRLLPILEHMQDPAVNSQIRANIEFQKLLVDLYMEKCSNRQEEYPKLERLLIHLKENPCQWWTVGDMAEMCNLSCDQFRRVFSQRTGVNPKLYLDRLKLNLAAGMLVNTQNDVMEIAEHFGYQDQYHFSRRFKAVLGMSPSEYRKNASLR